MPRLSIDSDSTLVGHAPDLSPIDQIPQDRQFRRPWLTFRTLGSLSSSLHSTPTTTTTPRMDDFAPEWQNVIAGIIRSRGWSETHALQPAMNRLWELVWATATSAMAKGSDYVDCTPGFHLGRLECPGGKVFSETTPQLTVQWMYRRLARLRPNPSSSTSSSSRSIPSSVATTASLTRSERSRAQKAICTPDMVGYATKRDPTENSSAPPTPDPSNREYHHHDDGHLYPQNNGRKRRRRDQRTPCIGAIVAEFKRQNVLKALCQCLIYLATAYEQCGTSLALLVIGGIGGAGRENIHFLRIVYDGSTFYVEMADDYVERHAASVTLDMLERDEQPLFQHLPNGWVDMLCAEGQGDQARTEITTVANVAAINRVIDFLGYARDQVTSLPSLDYPALKHHLGSAGRQLGRTVALRVVASSQSPEQLEESVDDGNALRRDCDSDRSLVSFPPTDLIADIPLPAMASSGHGLLPHLDQTIQVRNSDHPLSVFPIDPSASSLGDDNAPAQLSHVDKNMAFATMMARKDKDKLLAHVYAELLRSTAQVETNADEARLQPDPDDDGGNEATPGGPAGAGAEHASADPGASRGSGGATAATRDGGSGASSSAAYSCHLALANRCCAGRDDANFFDHDDYQDHNDGVSNTDACPESHSFSDSDSDAGETKVKTSSQLQDQDRAFRGTTLYATIKELAWPIAFVTAAEMDVAVAVRSANRSDASLGIGVSAGVSVDSDKARGPISHPRQNISFRRTGCSPWTNFRKGQAESDL